MTDSMAVVIDAIGATASAMPPADCASERLSRVHTFSAVHEGNSESSSGIGSMSNSSGADSQVEDTRISPPATTRAVSKKKPATGTTTPTTRVRAKSHVCTECPFASSRKLELDKHLLEHNIEKRVYQCEHCEKKCQGLIQLTNHRNIHLGAKPFSCEACQLNFTTKGELVRHTRYRHTHEKPHKCNVCEYSSVELSKLKRHMRTHTDERPYLCGFCDYASRDTFKLKRHIRIHTGEKPYECPVCPMRFTQSNSLKVHMKTHQTTALLDSPAGTTAKDEQLVPFSSSNNSSINNNNNNGSSRKKKRNEPRVLNSNAEHTTDGRVDETTQGALALRSDELPEATSSKRAALEVGIACLAAIGSSNSAASSPHHSHSPSCSSLDKDSSNYSTCSSYISSSQTGSSTASLSSSLASLSSAAACLALQSTTTTNVASDMSPVSDSKRAVRRCLSVFIKETDTTMQNEVVGHSDSAAAAAADNAWFKCKDCFMRFLTRELLDEHSVRHTGERPFECDICGMRFGLKFAMRQHVDSHDQTYSQMHKDKIKKYKLHPIEPMSPLVVDASLPVTERAADAAAIEAATATKEETNPQEERAAKPEQQTVLNDRSQPDAALLMADGTVMSLAEDRQYRNLLEALLSPALSSPSSCSSMTIEPQLA